MLNEQRVLECFPYDTYRKYQKEVTHQAIEAFDRGIKHVVISAPVGFGKSGAAITVSKYYGSAYIGTTQKSLQKQYCTDFDLPEFYGKSNYTCAVDPTMRCDNPTCKGEKAENCICPYQEAKRNCLASDVSIMNYALLFSMAAFAGQIEKRPVAIYDECHNLEDILTDFIGILISANTFKRLNIPMIPLPEENSTTLQVVKWIDKLLIPHVTDQMMVIENALAGYVDTKSKKDFARQYSFLDNFIKKIHYMCAFIGNGGKICTQVESDTITMKPLMVDFMAKQFLEDISERVLHISATVQSKELYCKCLGLDEKEVEYIQVGSVFPPENRPVVFAPVGSMAYAKKAETLPKMKIVIDRLLNERHPDQRGIIHTSTYEVAEYIYKNSEYNHRLILPKGKDREAMIKEFFNSDREDLVLISPSLGEGIDLKGDLAEFSILCKVPFPSLGDRWIKEKMDYIVGWYEEKTINKLIQSTGRHVRSEDEIGITYILDESFKWFYNRNKFRFPKWWTESLIMR